MKEDWPGQKKKIGEIELALEAIRGHQGSQVLYSTSICGLAEKIRLVTECGYGVNPRDNTLIPPGEKDIDLKFPLVQ